MKFQGGFNSVPKSCPNVLIYEKTRQN